MRFRTVKATGRFVKVEERNGEKCALIDVSVVADGTFSQPKGLKAVYRLKTRIVLGLETGRPHSMDGDGSITLDGTVEQDGQPIQLEGRCKISIKGRNEFK